MILVTAIVLGAVAWFAYEMHQAPLLDEHAAPAEAAEAP